jgi:hypothetical protein
MKNRTKVFLVGCTMVAGTILVPTGTAMAAQGCHRNDSLFAYTVNYAGYPRFVEADKNGDDLLCIRNNDPKYTGDPATLRIYDNDPTKA